MALYMLDTDISSYVIKRREPRLKERLADLRIDQVCISVITRAELLYGVARSSSKLINRSVVTEFLQFVRVLPWDDEAADRYAEIRVALERLGTPIGNLDTMIAAHAHSLRATLVTNNTKEFRRVSGLRVENWLEQG